MAWTSAVRQAWGWVKAGISRLLGREETLEQYTAGGGEVDAPEWREAWALGEQMYGQGRLIQDMPGEAVITRQWFTPVDIDYAGKYHLSCEMYYFDKRTQSWETKFVSANLDKYATRQDWEAAIIQAVKDTETSPEIDWKQGYDLFNFMAEMRVG